MGKKVALMYELHSALQKVSSYGTAIIVPAHTGSFIITGVKIMAYCSKIKSPGDFLRLLGAYQMWSIW